MEKVTNLKKRTSVLILHRHPIFKIGDEKNENFDNRIIKLYLSSWVKILVRSVYKLFNQLRVWILAPPNVVIHNKSFFSTVGRRYGTGVGNIFLILVSNPLHSCIFLCVSAISNNLCFKLFVQIFSLFSFYLAAKFKQLFHIKKVWLYVIVIPRTSFRVNPHSTICESKLLAQRGSHIWSLRDSNAIRTHNHLVCKRTFNHLVKLASLG